MTFSFTDFRNLHMFHTLAGLSDREIEDELERIASNGTGKHPRCIMQAAEAEIILRQARRRRSEFRSTVAEYARNWTSWISDDDLPFDRNSFTPKSWPPQKQLEVFFRLDFSSVYYYVNCSNDWPVIERVVKDFRSFVTSELYRTKCMPLVDIMYFKRGIERNNAWEEFMRLARTALSGAIHTSRSEWITQQLKQLQA